MWSRLRWHSISWISIWIVGSWNTISWHSLHIRHERRVVIIRIAVTASIWYRRIEILLCILTYRWIIYSIRRKIRIRIRKGRINAVHGRIHRLIGSARIDPIPINIRIWRNIWRKTRIYHITITILTPPFWGPTIDWLLFIFFSGLLLLLIRLRTHCWSFSRL